MKIYEISKLNPNILKNILKIWKDSVCATHLFLSEGEIARIKKYVPKAIKSVQHIVAAKNNSGIIAFMGTQNRRLEILFVSSFYTNKGIGKRLIITP